MPISMNIEWDWKKSAQLEKFYLLIESYVYRLQHTNLTISIAGVRPYPWLARQSNFQFSFVLLAVDSWIFRHVERFESSIKIRRLLTVISANYPISRNLIQFTTRGKLQEKCSLSDTKNHREFIGHKITIYYCIEWPQSTTIRLHKITADKKAIPVKGRRY